MRQGASGWARQLRATLVPAPAPLAIGSATCAVIAAATIAGVGVWTGHLVATGMAYFGVACASVFVTAGVYRARLLALVCQGAGAVAGFGLGSLAGPAWSKIVIAVLVAFVAGLIGAVGRLITSGAVMAVIGVAFAEFSGLAMPWWQQSLCYLLGTAAVGVIAVAPWVVRRNRMERAAVAAVFEASAELFRLVPSKTAAAARARLVAASATAQEAVAGHRLVPISVRSPTGDDLLTAFESAKSVALAAAASYADGRSTDEATIDAVRAAGDRLRRNDASVDPALDAVVKKTADETDRRTNLRLSLTTRRFQEAMRTATTGSAMTAAARLALCMGVATAVTCILHRESHAFWIPLTVGVIVRPEYGSVFVRTVNRGAGTVVGALIAAGLIAIFGSGGSVAIAAAVALGFGVLFAPRLYGLAVVGITCSALLSACIGTADPAYPGIRALDTLLGCAIAIIFGYLLWPGRRTLFNDTHLGEATAAARHYLTEAARLPRERDDWPPTRDAAYRMAHRSREVAQRGLLEPGPASTYAMDALQAALALEDQVDAITALATRVERQLHPATGGEVEALLRRINGYE
ncbi:MAG: hypothetical protein JWM76_2841 [Pseudonocardiales bacterium]|nr:hypothetical protein [Pseudonocardiales bacterium]